jgi:hypothetical protein
MLHPSLVISPILTRFWCWRCGIKVTTECASTFLRIGVRPSDDGDGTIVTSGVNSDAAMALVTR